jgi:hypothetical protein
MPSGPRLVAFLAVIYYAALRPEEAVNLHRDNITLPPFVQNAATGEWEEPADNWGEVRFCSASTEIGTGPDGRVFSGIQRGDLASITFRRARWW